MLLLLVRRNMLAQESELEPGLFPNAKPAPPANVASRSPDVVMREMRSELPPASPLACPQRTATPFDCRRRPPGPTPPNVTGIETLPPFPNDLSSVPEASC